MPYAVATRPKSITGPSSERLNLHVAMPKRTAWKHPPRGQAWEFCDQTWLRGVWRGAYLDGLNFLFKLGGIYARMHEVYGRWAREAGGDRVLELASGGAGPISTMLDAARRDGATMPAITLSDLHPDLDTFRRMAQEYPACVDYVSEPVDASAVPTAASGHPLRSMCTGFHHFSPTQARKMLAATVANADGLFLMEPMPCSWLALAMSLPNVPILMLAPFFAKRFSLWKCLISTLLPLVPLMIVWDGVVSALRIYRPEEILALVPESERSQWTWEWGEQRCLLVFKATYFFGYRRLKGVAP